MCTADMKASMKHTSLRTCCQHLTWHVQHISSSEIYPQLRQSIKLCPFSLRNLQHLAETIYPSEALGGKNCLLKSVPEISAWAEFRVSSSTQCHLHLLKKTKHLCLNDIYKLSSLLEYSLQWPFGPGMYPASMIKLFFTSTPWNKTNILKYRVMSLLAKVHELYYSTSDAFGHQVVGLHL